MILLRFEQPYERSFREFAQSLYAKCPDRPELSVDLREPMQRPKRAICGEHGRIVPTRQDLCPTCGGIVEIMTEQRAAAMRRLWKELKAS